MGLLFCVHFANINPKVQINVRNGNIQRDLAGHDVGLFVAKSKSHAAKQSERQQFGLADIRNAYRRRRAFCAIAYMVG